MTIWEIAFFTSKSGDNFELYKGDFLDEFYRSNNDRRRRMIEQEPEPYENLSVRILPFLAGMVEKLCHEYGLECPQWIYKDSYYLEDPNFWMDAQGKLRIHLLVESPIEFKIRNIFTTSNCLVRI